MADHGSPSGPRAPRSPDAWSFLPSELVGDLKAPFSQPHQPAPIVSDPLPPRPDPWHAQVPRPGPTFGGHVDRHDGGFGYTPPAWSPWMDASPSPSPYGVQNPTHASEPPERPGFLSAETSPQHSGLAPQFAPDEPFRPPGLSTRRGQNAFTAHFMTQGASLEAPFRLFSEPNFEPTQSAFSGSPWDVPNEPSLPFSAPRPEFSRPAASPASFGPNDATQLPLRNHPFALRLRQSPAAVTAPDSVAPDQEEPMAAGEPAEGKSARSRKRKASKKQRDKKKRERERRERADSPPRVMDPGLNKWGRVLGQPDRPQFLRKEGAPPSLSQAAWKPKDRREPAVMTDPKDSHLSDSSPRLVESSQSGYHEAFADGPEEQAEGVYPVAQPADPVEELMHDDTSQNGPLESEESLEVTPPVAEIISEVVEADLIAAELSPTAFEEEEGSATEAPAKEEAEQIATPSEGTPQREGESLGEEPVVEEEPKPVAAIPEAPEASTEPKEVVPDHSRSDKSTTRGPGLLAMIWALLCALVSPLVGVVVGLHHSALGVFVRHHVAFTVTYIYTFPFLVSLFTDGTTPAASIIWYGFLVWFFINKGNLSGVHSSTALNIRLLLPLLFVFEAVCNPRAIVMWNGGERLVLAFVLLSMKADIFFHWSCFASLALLILTSVVLGANILVQWAILVIALSSLSPSFSIDPMIRMRQDEDEAEQYLDGDSEDEGSADQYSSYNPSFEVNLLPPATAVGFYSSGSHNPPAPRKRSKRNR